jgi:RNA polymerase sigma-70 factor (ECF subfamily)
MMQPAIMPGMSVADSDEALMQRFAVGDAPAFDTLYQRHEMKLWRYLRRGVGEQATAEELMQEVWFTVAREAPRYRPVAKFTTWLFTLAHHRLIDHWRTRRPHAPLEAVEELIEDDSPTPLQQLQSQQQAAALLTAVEQLPPEQRAAFLLQAEGEMSVEDIATTMGVSFETTKSRLRYARARLRQLLQECA